jgi:predicted lactoylglutathione lyase
MIFVNLPVADLARATTFYEAIGATKNPQFSDETAACMVLSETIHVMLLTHDKFRQFTPRRIAGRDSVEVLNCLSADSREAVDAFAELAAKAGGKADHIPSQDHGFMYFRSVEDPDGHVWEIMHMDMEAAAAAIGKS